MKERGLSAGDFNLGRQRAAIWVFWGLRGIWRLLFLSVELLSFRGGIQKTALFLSSPGAGRVSVPCSYLKL